jgi:hypothetical protein
MVTANSIATMEKRTRPIAVAGTLVATVITNVPLPWGGFLFGRQTYRVSITKSHRLVGAFCNKLILLQYLVGAAGFEPTTCSTQNCRATRLRYTPIIWETSSIHA